MSDDYKNIDHLFKNTFDDFEPEVPSYIWNNIEDELQGKKKKRLLIWYRSAAAVILLLVAFGSGYLFSEYQNQSGMQHFAVNSAKEQVSQQEIENKESENVFLNEKKESNKSEMRNLIAENKQTVNENNKQNENNTQVDFANEISKNKSIKRETSFDKNKALKDKDFNKTINKNAVTNENIPAIAINDENQDYKLGNELVLTQLEQPEINNKNLLSANNETQNNKTSVVNNVDIVSTENNNIEIASAEGANNNSNNNSIVNDSGNQVIIGSKNDSSNNYEIKDVFSQQFSLADIRNIGPESIEVSCGADSMQIPKINQLAYFSKPKPSKEINREEIEIDANQNRNRFVIGGEISPLYAFQSSSSSEQVVDAPMYSMSQNHIMDNASTSTTRKENDVQAVLAYSGGINVAYEMTDRFSVKSGIYYSKKEQRIDNVPVEQVRKRSNTYFNADVANVSVKFAEKANEELYNIKNDNYDARKEAVYDYTELANTTRDYYQLGLSLKQSFEYLEIPLIMKYKLIDSKFDFNVQGGVTTGILFANEANVTGEGQDLWSGKTQDVNSFNYTASFGIGLEYDIFRSISLNVAPTIRYSINSLSSNDMVYDYPYSFSVFTGINYRF